MNSECITLVLFLCNLWWPSMINGYIEKRTFRERTKIFCRLSHQCKQYEESEDEYRQLMNLSDVAGTQPDGYLVRFPFYILAERDAHVVFTESESPDWFADNVYEFVFGGWENKRTTLRRSRQGEDAIFQYTDEILSKTVPLKFLIEITTAGQIRVFVEHTVKPILEFKDSNPLQIKYFGFTSLGSLAKYFYDCQGDEVYSTSQLAKSCKHTEVSTSEHTQLIPVNLNRTASREEYAIDFPLYVQASRNAHIRLSAKDSEDKPQDAYEIVIGEDMNRRVSIQKLQESNITVLADYRRGDILGMNETLIVYLRIEKDGTIKVFSKHEHTQFKLLASIKDKFFTSPQLSYVSFASDNNTAIQFFYECRAPLHTPFIDFSMATKYAPIGNPLLLEDPDFRTPIDKRNWLTSRCKYYTNPKYEYKDFFKLSDIQDSQPPGYQARLAFYAQGTRNAHVLLSRSATPDVAVDNVYEFIIGGWVNSRVLIRRKKSDPNQVLQQVFVNSVLSSQTATKFVIEVTNNGFVRIFSENDKLEPIASIFDPTVLPVRFVSFCGYDNLVRFYYDCNGNREKL